MLRKHGGGIGDTSASEAIINKIALDDRLTVLGDTYRR
jgi:hypothetical protein